MFPAKPSRTGKGLVAAHEATFATEEDGTSGRWRLAPEKGRPSRQPSGGVVPLSGSTGGDGEIVELAPEVYWVGRRQGRVLEGNAYLRVWKRDGTEISLLVDPGRPQDLEMVTQKVEKVIGSLTQLDYVFIRHRDPDVAGDASPIHQQASRARVIGPERPFRLGAGPDILFVPTPFCPIRGATMLYDPLSRVLFSGDLFSGARATDLVASDRSWPGVEMFHQVHMPSRRALALAVAAIRKLDPQPALIAPAHGALVVGDDVPRMLDRIENLEVGLDLLESPADGEPFCAAGNDLVRELGELAGETRAKELLQSFAGDSSFPPLIVVDGGQIVQFNVPPKLGLEALASDALAALPADQRGDLQRSIREIWKQHDLI
jgi:glyoxylase-like metal-dependent hydrolase (beta-lactamase superfamily II)